MTDPLATKHEKMILHPRQEVLRTAENLICCDREQDYGSPYQSFQRIARLWSAYLSVQIQASEVAVMMALLKASRQVASPDKKDSYDDGAGYFALAYECHLKEAQLKGSPDGEF